MPQNLPSKQNSSTASSTNIVRHNAQTKISVRVSSNDVADLAFKLYASANSPYALERFKECFAFAFELLVDADFQLQNLDHRAKLTRDLHSTNRRKLDH